VPVAASVVISTPTSAGGQTLNRKRRSIHTACQGMVSIEEAAELLRTEPAIVEEAMQRGQLPTATARERLYVDGPALLSEFGEPVYEEGEHAP
jgi:hypothetical protein